MNFILTKFNNFLYNIIRKFISDHINNKFFISFFSCFCAQAVRLNAINAVQITVISFILSSIYLFFAAFTHTGSSLMAGLLTAITPERLWGTYGSSI